MVQSMVITLSHALARLASCFGTTSGTRPAYGPAAQFHQNWRCRNASVYSHTLPAPLNDASHTSATEVPNTPATRNGCRRPCFAEQRSESAPASGATTIAVTEPATPSFNAASLPSISATCAGTSTGTTVIHWVKSANHSDAICM